MKAVLNHEILGVFEQLKWVLRRRDRMVNAVSAHFGKEPVTRLLERHALLIPPIHWEDRFEDFLDERDTEARIRALAFETEKFEASCVTALRAELSLYQSHVDEQLLFGARTAGQDAGRNFLSLSSAAKAAENIQLADAVYAVFLLTYCGFPSDKNYFLSQRPQFSVSVHYKSSPHQAAWQAANASPAFLSKIREEWILGILEIIHPKVRFSPQQSLEKGAAYGLEEFRLWEKNV